jgi:protein piccolo
MRVVGGLEIPGSRHGEIGAFVTEISPGGVVDTHGEVQEGDQVLEWNGIQLNSKSFEEVQSIISSTRGEVEIVICGYKSTTHAIPFLSSNRSRFYFGFPPGRRPARSTPSPTSSNIRGPLLAHARKSTWTEIATTGIIWRVNSARLRRRKSSLSRQLDLNSRSLKVINKSISQ